MTKRYLDIADTPESAAEEKQPHANEAQSSSQRGVVDFDALMRERLDPKTIEQVDACTVGLGGAWEGGDEQLQPVTVIVTFTPILEWPLKQWLDFFADQVRLSWLLALNDVALACSPASRTNGGAGLPGGVFGYIDIDTLEDTAAHRYRPDICITRAAAGAAVLGRLFSYAATPDDTASGDHLYAALYKAAIVSGVGNISEWDEEYMRGTQTIGKYKEDTTIARVSRSVRRYTLHGWHSGDVMTAWGDYDSGTATPTPMPPEEMAICSCRLALEACREVIAALDHGSTISRAAADAHAQSVEPEGLNFTYDGVGNLWLGVPSISNQVCDSDSGGGGWDKLLLRMQAGKRSNAVASSPGTSGNFRGSDIFLRQWQVGKGKNEKYDVELPFLLGSKRSVVHSKQL